MSRLSRYLVFVILAELLLLRLGVAAPNVLVILTDDQAWGDLRGHGNQNLDTPSLDRLAAEGTRFLNFYVQPVCSPTRAEFLTGRYFPRGGVYSTGGGGERLDADEQTIADVFKDAGYRTAAFGKWHNGTQSPYHPLDRGFDEFYGFTSGHWGSYFSPILDRSGQIIQGSGFLPDDLTRETIRFMESSVENEEAFFAYLAFPTPHTPLQVPDEDWERVKDKPLLSRYQGEGNEELDFTRGIMALIENIDSNVGRLLDSLDALGIAEETIVVFFSDNGGDSWRWNDGMRGRKGSGDEGGVRSPLFVRWPGGIEAGRELRQIVGSIDLLPTLTHLSGVDWVPSQEIDGVSLGDTLLGREEQYPDRYLFTHWHEGTTVRDQRYRLDAKGRLYDIESDRGQTTDLKDRLPSVYERLKKEAERWNSEVKPMKIVDRPITVGFPGLAMTQLPARDAQHSKGIERSNRWPNCSYLTNWDSEADEIFWEIEVGETGQYRPVIYYSCAPESVGAKVVLSTGKNKSSQRVTSAHVAQAYGMEHDRYPRKESYVKDFALLELDAIRLERGKERLSLKADKLVEGSGMEFRLLTLERIGSP